MARDGLSPFARVSAAPSKQLEPGANREQFGHVLSWVVVQKEMSDVSKTFRFAPKYPRVPR